MPVYEYECSGCEKVFEVQQRIADDPVETCPDCGGVVKKLISRSSFQLKGGGWYADGYAGSGKGVTTSAPSPKAESSSAPSCPAAGGACGNCPAAS